MSTATVENVETNFDVEWEALRGELEKQHGCSLKLTKKFRDEQTLPIFILTGSYNPSKFRLNRFHPRYIFPWEDIQPACTDFLTKQLGKGNFSLACLEESDLELNR